MLKGRNKEQMPTILHLFDALVENTLGKTNLDLNKNITVDILMNNDKTKEEAIAQWRDINGFVVCDKHRFEEVLVNRPTILHLFDALVENTLGKTNLDLNKNITVDILMNNDKTKEEAIAQWRDINGFVVCDKHRFEEVLVNRSYLLSLADEAAEMVTEPINETDLLPVLDYDAETSIYDRTEHVTALVHTPGVVGKVALRAGVVCGYALACKNRILACYADDEESFKQLISSVAENIDGNECKMFLRFESHDVTQRIIENASERKEVMRLHTRTNLNGIKWSQIYCSNNGLHIF
ncbi:hypothetical protein COOONC_01927 [Cooperia oncophora]